MILFHPIAAVREQEMDYLIFAIVEAEAVPCWMLVPIARIEELVGIAAEIAQSFHLILDGMRMYDVHDYCHTIFMCGVYHLLKVFRCTETARGSKERTDMIAKRTIVWMLLYGHHLYAVISVCHHPGQHILCKLLIGAHLLGILRHAHMALIDEQWRLVGFEFLFLEYIL